MEPSDEAWGGMFSASRTSSLMVARPVAFEERAGNKKTKTKFNLESAGTLPKGSLSYRQ